MGSLFPREGFAGTVGGSFFRAPPWVDEAKPPGTSSQAAAFCKSPEWWAHAFSGYSLFFSPNLVWLLIALLDYAVFPYDLPGAAAGVSLRLYSRRLRANALITLGYVGYWHVSLYWLGFGRRPFNPSRRWRWAKVGHNLLYTVLAIAQLSAW